MKVYYHAHCLDGFTAAWVLHCAEEYNEAEFHALQHSDKESLLDDVQEKGEVVTFVDICPPAHVIEALLTEKEAHVYIYDHHKSEEEMLTSFDGRDRFHLTFDETHSGAGIAWYTRHRKPAPDIVAYVQDRDLWKWDLPGTKEYTSALYIEERTFKRWSELASLPTATEKLLGIGGALVSAEKSYVEAVAPEAYVIHKKVGAIAVVNATSHHVSELLHRLVKEGARGRKVIAAAAWALKADRSISFSIRGDIKATGVDVSKIAATYGGGGHPNAAGFRVSSMREMREWLP